MNLARVVGRVVAPRRAPNFTEPLLLVLQALDEDLSPKGLPIVAVDPISSAGTGDLVYYVSGSDATSALADSFQPVDAAIVGFVEGMTGGTASARASAEPPPTSAVGEGGED